jgi:hypothetical protein
MTPHLMPLLVALLPLMGHALETQAKPDFSGRWVQVVPTGKEEGSGSEQVVTQDGMTLTTEHPSEGGSHRQVYKLDGESRSTIAGVEVISNTAWDGQKLVITSTATYPGNRKRESKQVWSLGQDGSLIIEHSAKNPDGTRMEIQTIHRKK